MAYSFSEDTGDGVKTTFIFTFVGPDNGYFNPDEIIVEVDGVETAYTLTGPTQVTLSPAPADGAKVRILREPNLDAPYTDFVRGNSFGKININRSFAQQLYVSHRLIDGFKEIGYYEKQDLSMGTIYRITNLADGVNPQDAATVSQMGDNVTETEAFKDAAEAAAAEAAGHSSDSYDNLQGCITSVTLASASATAAAISEANAALSEANAADTLDQIDDIIDAVDLTRTDRQAILRMPDLIPVDEFGIPGGTLSHIQVPATVSDPMVVSSAKGFGPKGALDNVTYSEAPLQIIAGAAGEKFIYIDDAGSLQLSLTRPAYSDSTEPTGWSFNTKEMRMYFDSVETPAIFIGRCDVDGGGLVSNLRTYAAGVIHTIDWMAVAVYSHYYLDNPYGHDLVSIEVWYRGDHHTTGIPFSTSVLYNAAFLGNGPVVTIIPETYHLYVHNYVALTSVNATAGSGFYAGDYKLITRRNF